MTPRKSSASGGTSRWRIDVVRRPGLPRLLPNAGLVRAATAALDAAGAPTPGSVTIVLTDDAELTELNREHMGHEGPTDVLSFPMLPAEAFTSHDDGRAPATRGRGTTGPRGRRTTEPPGDGGCRRDDPARPRRRTHIGDIAISIERAIEQAEAGRGGQTGDVRWSPADELRLLATHGALHLCGWDHATASDEAQMRALEQRILSDARPSARYALTSGRDTHPGRRADGRLSPRQRS